MKKKFPLLAAAVVLLAVLTGIYFIILSGTGAEPEDIIGVEMDADIISSDHTVFPGFIYNTDAIGFDSLAGEKRCPAEDIEKPQLNELIEGSQEVLRAEVVSLSYTFTEGKAWTQADILISEVLKGLQQPGNYISVYFPGGYASVQDYNLYYNKGKPGDANKYYSFAPPAGRLPYQGDDLLLFLSPSAGETGIPQGAYVLSFGHYSVFNVLEDGKLIMQDESYTDYSKLQNLFK